jgi:transposase
MGEITRVGVDLAKSVIQVHAVDAAGKLVANRQLSRDKFLTWCAQLPAGCLVAMEACGGSQHWASMGVMPFVTRGRRSIWITSSRG